MGIIGWVIIGALAGWIASLITGNDKKMGAGMNILVGVIGGLIGGLVMNLIGGYGITGFNLWSLLVATVGAIILLLLANAVRKRSN
ncbi:MAG: GlsB/YeaQ/YmgE family stress response membrane protein [Clostridia bacterium]|nr:GlsB/YeaQ/YmgE family stress response membrane protein [Clostridia bacterium]MDD4798640.1 GlsB/YeaQ/YmgE family stress response membrane protein [Clostridia bacterium]